MAFKKSLFAAVLLTLPFLEGRETLYTFTGSEKVLDLCCGDGDFSLEIAKVVRKGAVCGVDFSKAVIEEAKKKHLRAPSHLSFKYKDSKDCSFSELYDVVTSLSLAASHYQPKELLRKVYQLLKPQGMVDIAFIKKIPIAIQSALKASMTDEKWSDYFLTFHPPSIALEEKEIKTIFENLKFKTIKSKNLAEDQIFSSTEEFQVFIKKWLPYFGVLPEPKQQDFLDFFTEKYLKIFPRDKEGHIHFLVERYEILAQKT